jgi:hypothetical protein
LCGMAVCHRGYELRPLGRAKQEKAFVGVAQWGWMGHEGWR